MNDNETEQEAWYELFDDIFPRDDVHDRLSIPTNLKSDVEKFEKEHLLDALVRYEYNQTKASRRLGIKRTTLIAKMRKFNIAA